VSLDFVSAGTGGQFTNSTIEQRCLALFTDGQFGSLTAVIVVGDLVDVWVDEFSLFRVYGAEVVVLEVVEASMRVLRTFETTVTLSQSIEQTSTLQRTVDADAEIRRQEAQEFER